MLDFILFLVYSFDQGGNFLITGASDANIYVLNARASRVFEVIGYTGTLMLHKSPYMFSLVFL